MGVNLFRFARHATSVWTDLFIFTWDLACDYLLFSCTLNLLTDTTVNEKNKQTLRLVFLTKVVYQSVQMTVMIGRWHHKNTHITKFSTNNYLELCCQRQQTEKQLLNKFMLLRALLKWKRKQQNLMLLVQKCQNTWLKKLFFWLGWCSSG